MTIFTSAPKGNQQENTVDEKIDELATELEIRRMRLFEERMSATQERATQITKEIQVLEDNLKTLKRAKKIPDLQTVRKVLQEKIVKPKTDDELAEDFTAALTSTGELQADNRRRMMENKPGVLDENTVYDSLGGSIYRRGAL